MEVYAVGIDTRVTVEVEHYDHAEIVRKATAEFKVELEHAHLIEWSIEADDEADGTSGQDRESYIDTQDRESYAVDEAGEQ